MIIGRGVGRGNTAEVYLVDKEKVIKLFHKNYSYDPCYKEYCLGIIVNQYDLPVPKVYEFLKYGSQYGIVYEYIEGSSLFEYLYATKNISYGGKLMASLQKQIHSKTIENRTIKDKAIRDKAIKNNGKEVKTIESASMEHITMDKLPSYKEFLYHMIPNDLEDNLKRWLHNRIDMLEDGNTICHGDFHPGNIILRDENPTVIDFMNICKGTSLYDISRTVYLTKYTPLPNTLGEDEKKVFQGFRSELIDIYLEELGVIEQELIPYLDMIAITRRWECPEEKSRYLVSELEDIWNV